MTGDWDPDAQPIQVHGDAPSQPTYLQSRSEPAQFIPRRCVGRKQYICKEIHLRCQPRISEVFAVSTGTLPLNDNASRRFRQRTLVVMLTSFPHFGHIIIIFSYSYCCALNQSRTALRQYVMAPEFCSHRGLAVYSITYSKSYSIPSYKIGGH